MTYFGTTVTSTAKNPPNTVFRSPVGGRVAFPGVLSTRPMGAHLWLYTSTNGASDTTAAGVFIDGTAIGMYPGDLILGVHNGGAATTDGYIWCGVLNSTESTLSTGAYNLSSNRSTSPY